MAHRLLSHLLAVLLLAMVAWYADAVPIKGPPSKEEIDREKLAPPHYTRSRTFDLPVCMEPEYQATLSEVRLYVKGPGPKAGWTLQGKGSPDLRRFSCKVNEDGEYWYTLAVVDKTGRMTPPDIAKEPPSLRVIVDTTAPTIAVGAWTTDGLGLRCFVSDANPDLKTLKAVCRTDAGEVVMELVKGQENVFRIQGAEWLRYNVTVSVKDLAGNVGTTEVSLGEIFKSNAKKPMPSP